jgi:hypothetical protein
LEAGRKTQDAFVVSAAGHLAVVTKELDKGSAFGARNARRIGEAQGAEVVIFRANAKSFRGFKGRAAARFFRDGPSSEHLPRLNRDADSAVPEFGELAVFPVLGRRREAFVAVEFDPEEAAVGAGAVN